MVPVFVVSLSPDLVSAAILEAFFVVLRTSAFSRKPSQKYCVDNGVVSKSGQCHQSINFDALDRIKPTRLLATNKDEVHS